MKKAVTTLLAIACLFSLMSVTAFAANEVSGVYNLWTESGYTLIPKDANGNDVASGTVNGMNDFYAGAERFTLTGSGSEGYHLVLMLNGTSTTPTEKNIYYIDQDTGGSINFGIYPKAMQNESYTVYISSSDGTGLTKIASFTYYQPYTLGDVNASGKIDVSDALQALKHAVEKTKLEGNQFLAADVNRSGVVDVSDALQILKFAVEKITSFD